MAIGTSMTSRVVPATSVTIARSLWLKALIRLDFPAFVGPAATTLIPCFKQFDAGLSQPLGEFSRERLRLDRERGDVSGGLLLVIDIIDRRLGPCRQQHDPLPPALDQPRHAAIRAQQRGSALAFGFRFEQVGQPFGLGQVDSAIGEGATGEFARLGGANAGQGKQRVENRSNHRSAAMALIFNNIFAG